MSVELSAMPADRLRSWMITSSADYEEARRMAGDSAEVAAEKARASFESSFPGGEPAPGHLVYDIVVTDIVVTDIVVTDTAVTDTAVTDTSAPATVVGYLWIAPFTEGSDAWWVFDIAVDEQHRGAGFGRAAMQLAEKAVAEHGAATLGLNVFGYNTAARGLYDSLGYETTAVQMRKAV